MNVTSTDAQRKPKVIVVVGSTGAGKSQIAIDVALRCNGEIVNADAMQVLTLIYILG